MIEGARRLSRQHITVCVPWHDIGWTGHVCAASGANTSCLALAASPKASEPIRRLRAGFLSGRDLI